MSWLTAEEALRALKTKPQTLYANVSRGRIRAKPDPTDPRRSLYQASDVQRLAERHAGRRKTETVAAEAIRWGDPVLSSAISTIIGGRLFYRGKDAADFAEVATLEQTAALDAYLVTISDHGLNASTFASRVIASTQAGHTSTVLAALSALKGPLHGGAPGPVLDMLDAIATAENAGRWIEEALDRGERLMGFGHRIYRVRDPRADALKGALKPLISTGQVNSGRGALAEAVEAAALAILKARKPNRPLDVNVEFYTALLLETLGFPREAFTGVFAIGRTVGWLAHAREQALNGRLIRPRSVYIGPLPAAA